MRSKKEVEEMQERLKGGLGVCVSDQCEGFEEALVWLKGGKEPERITTYHPRAKR